MVLDLLFYAVLGLTALGLLLYVGGAFNQMVRCRREIDRAFANVEVMLQQRHDELPNLVETCRGYVAHEGELLERIAGLRGRFTAAPEVDDKVRAANRLTRDVDRLMALSESYPQLQARELFASLQRRLVELENAIADRRELFNATVTAYNIYIETLPIRLVAGLFGFHARPQLELADGGETAPTVVQPS